MVRPMNKTYRTAGFNFLHHIENYLLKAFKDEIYRHYFRNDNSIEREDIGLRQWEKNVRQHEIKNEKSVQMEKT